MAFPVATRATGFRVTAAVWNDDLVANINHIINSSGNLAIINAGPHALGTANDPNVQFKIGGTHTPQTVGVGTMVTPTINAIAGQDAYGLYVLPTLVEAGTGAHNLFASAMIVAPQISGGAASTTFAATLFIGGAPSIGTYNVPLYIEGGGHDGMHVVLSDTDIAHGVTDLAPTTVYFLIRKASATDGGVALQGYSEADNPTKIHGIATTENTTTGGSANGCIQLIGEKKSGTGTTTLGATANLVTFKNGVNATHIFKANGDAHLDGSGWSVYDAFNDEALIELAEYQLSGGAIRRHFAQWVADERALLESLELLSFDDQGRMFYNATGLIRVLCGAMRQAGQTIRTLEGRLARLELARA